MLELPEACTIAGQMERELRGKRVAYAVAGASPHKFAFFNRPAAEYADLLCGRTVAGVADDGGGWIIALLDPDTVLLFGEMGGRILYCPDAKAVPPKHQLLLGFDDGSALVASIALWGAIQVIPRREYTGPKYFRERLSPLSPDFTWERFQELLAHPEERTLSAKAFMISKPGFAGIGNGSLQDILFRARLHPRRRIAELSAAEGRTLYDATRDTLASMIEQGGRDVERDLYNQPGGYHCLLDSRSNGQPCPACGTPIQKIAFLGGASYLCPSCQAL